MIFSKSGSSNERLKHLLCQGFRREASLRSIHRDENVASAIPGVISTYPNSHVTSLKASPWPEILALMGKQGESVMIDLLLDCGIFIPIETSRGSYHQLSGQSIPRRYGTLLRIKYRRASWRPSKYLNQSSDWNE